MISFKASTSSTSCSKGSSIATAKPLQSSRVVPSLIVRSSHAPEEKVTERLARNYHAVQNPIQASTTYSKAVTAFTASAVLAYECGYSEEGLRKGLSEMQETSDQPVTQKNCPASCLELSLLVWITLMLAPKSVVRWGVGSAVSEETLAIWKGFVSLIVNAYFEQRMSWYPIDRLQTEMSLSTGSFGEPSLVAERARIVFATLESVAPQFPSM